MGEAVQQLDLPVKLDQQRHDRREREHVGELRLALARRHRLIEQAHDLVEHVGCGLVSVNSCASRS